MSRRRSAWIGVAIAIVGVLAVALHAWRIAGVPHGLFVDETSIGYNAWQIAQSGHDEHGVAWPLYFRAFGEYKNPVYIYFLAAIYKVFGLSETATRAASFAAWLIGSLLLFDLFRRLTKDRAVLLYAVICLGFTPWLFTLSRISFEVISLFPLLALHLWAVYRAYEGADARWALLGGIALGAAAYAYSTFRMLAPLYALAAMLVYSRREFRRRNAWLLAGFAATALPLAFYLLTHAGNLTARFGELTYLHDPGSTAWDKAAIFMGRYLEYFGPDFLARHGDSIERHHTGYGGQLLLATILLALFGLVSAWRRGSSFTRLLAVGAAIAPLAAALTRDHGHSLRAFSLVVFALPLSVVGAIWLRERIGAAAVMLLASCAAVQGALYCLDYFTRYAAATDVVFVSRGFEPALRAALARGTGRVIVDEGQIQPYIHVLFYREILAVEDGPSVRERSIVLGREDALQPGDAYVMFDPMFRCAGCREGLPVRGLYAVKIAAADGGSSPSFAPVAPGSAR